MTLCLADITSRICQIRDRDTLKCFIFVRSFPENGGKTSRGSNQGLYHQRRHDSSVLRKRLDWTVQFGQLNSYKIVGKVLVLPRVTVEKNNRTSFYLENF